MRSEPRWKRHAVDQHSCADLLSPVCHRSFAGVVGRDKSIADENDNVAGEGASHGARTEICVMPISYDAVWSTKWKRFSLLWMNMAKIAVVKTIRWLRYNSKSYDKQIARMWQVRSAAREKAFLFEFSRCTQKNDCTFSFTFTFALEFFHFCATFN